MGAYFLNYVRMRDGIPRLEGLAQVKRTVEAYGGRWHSHREDQGLEDGGANSVVLVEFGSMTEAESFYNSSEYKNVLDLYVGNAIDLVLADGVSPDFTMAGFAQVRPLSRPSKAPCRFTTDAHPFGRRAWQRLSLLKRRIH